MDKQKEIERIAKLLPLYTPINCNNSKVAEAFVNAGYGDVKQAVREFAERLKELCNEKRKLFEALYDNCAPLQAELAREFIEKRNEWIEMKQKIDELVKEVCGE